MDCNNGNRTPVSIDFQNAGELHPNKVNFSSTNSDYDTLRCKFNSKTANSLLENRSNGLDGIQKATIKISGEPIRAMYYNPNFLRLGENLNYESEYGILELHDLHEHLKDGIVDYAPKEASVEDVYKEIFNSRDDSNNLFNGLKFNIEDPDASVREVRDFKPGENGGILGVSSPVNDDELLDIDFSWAINFDEISPLKAIQQANKKLALTTHIDSSGNLVVGRYDNNSEWVANKSRGEDTFLIKSIGVTGSNVDIKRLILEGGISKNPPLLKDPGNFLDEVGERLNPFNPDREKAGLRAKVKIELDTDSQCRTEVIKGHDLRPRPKNMVPVARRAFVGIMARNPSGTLSLDLNNGKSDAISIGDKILVEEPNTCGDMTNPAYEENKYIISGVHYEYDGIWEVTLDLLNDFTDVLDRIETNFSMDDITDNQSYSFEEIYGYKKGREILNDD